MRPLCRYCGKPLPKRTTSRYLSKDQPAWNREDCQHMTNEKVITVRYGLPGYTNRVRMFTTWDERSYESVYGQGFFCTLRCASNFAGVFARLGHGTSAYYEALEKQEKRP
jgi:hypothetical protein